MMEYTTEQLIKSLTMGQKAEMTSPVTDIIVQRTANGIVVLQDAISTKHVGQNLPLTGLIMNATWNFERKQITFAQALEHIRNGVGVSCEYNGEVERYFDMEDVMLIAEAIEGQWYLEQ